MCVCVCVCVWHKSTVVYTMLLINYKISVHMKRYDEHQGEYQKRVASYDEKVLRLEQVHINRFFLPHYSHAH